MSELVLVPALSRAEVKALLRGRLERLGLAAGWCVEDVLGEGAPIDLVGADATGSAVAVLVAEPGRELETVAAALAQRAWLLDRLPDWRKLAPQIPVRPEAGARAAVIGGRFGPAERAAARAGGPASVELWLQRGVRNGSGLELLLEPVEGAEERPGRVTSEFRTGVSDAQLALSAAERREFE